MARSALGDPLSRCPMSLHSTRKFSCASPCESTSSKTCRISRLSEELGEVWAEAWIPASMEIIPKVRRAIFTKCMMQGRGRLPNFGT